MESAENLAPVTLADLRDRRRELLQIAERHGASNVRIFGSVLRGDASAGSDVDFLVSLDERRSLLDLGGLQMDLRDALGCEVDVVTDTGLRERSRDHVLAAAAPLWETTPARLRDILEACELLIRETGPRLTELRSDPVIQAATQRWIEIIGEAASRLSDQVRDANPDIPWRSMIGMRNVLVHGYFDLDPAVVEAVVGRDIPMIARRITEILEQS